MGVPGLVRRPSYSERLLLCPPIASNDPQRAVFVVARMGSENASTSPASAGRIRTIRRFNEG